jgi:hypothetical protein
MLTKKYILDGKNQIIGSKTAGFGNGYTIARDREGILLGRANQTLQNTRDSQGRLVSTKSSLLGNFLSAGHGSGQE